MAQAVECHFAGIKDLSSNPVQPKKKKNWGLRK
jgi:hypothetical protein